jgi:transposase-like protein
VDRRRYNGKKRQRLLRGLVRRGYLSVEGVLAKYRVSRATLYRWWRREGLPLEHRGCFAFISESAFKKFLVSRWLR